jgi:hypothetical protein
VVLQALSEQSGMAARMFDQTGDAIPAEVQERGPYFDTARPP